MGVKFSSSAIEGPGLPCPWLMLGDAGGDPVLLASDGDGMDFQVPGPAFVRRRDSVRGVIGWPALGAAVTIVPTIAIGGGRGLLGLKRGWISSSIDEPSIFGRFWSREVGLEKFGGGLEVGEEDVMRGGELG